MKTNSNPLRTTKRTCTLTAACWVSLHSGLRRLGAFALLCLIALGSASLQAQTVTVNPTEYPDALTNPLMGFRDGFETSKPSNWKTKPYQTIYRHYIHWNLIENSPSDGVQKIKDYCNTMWAGCEAANVKIIPRVILQYGDGQYYFPSYLPTPSATNLAPWKSVALRTAVTNMIAKLGQAWDTDPRVAWVQTGIIGKWGEQESDVGVDENVVDPDNANWATIMGQAFAAAFPNKIQLVRNQDDWTQPMGVYWDSFAHTGQYGGAWTAIKNYNALGRYLVAPVEGEIAYNWGTGRTNFGFTPNETCSTPAYYDFVINTIKQLHCSGLGWVSGYTPGPATATGANLIQKAYGYRFHITEFQCSARTEPGSNLTMSAKVKNTGSAVIHANYPLAFVLVNESTRLIVHQSIISGTDIRTWKPGSNYNWDPQSNPNGSKVYLTPALENTINASIPIPAGIAPGQYLAGIAILEPSTQKPGVFFAVSNYFKQSFSQPLCRIGIGADATNNIVTGPFDHLVNDDTRNYTTNQVGGNTVTVIATDASAGEPSNSGMFTFTRTGSTTGALTVNFTVTGTASGSDYASLGTTVAFAIGQTNATKTVTVNDDATYEGNETVIVTIGSGLGYSIGIPTSATVNIADDEVFVGEVTPWLEDFQSQAAGATSDGPPTSWTATPTNGSFRVLAGEMAFNNVGTDGEFTSGAINISSGPVTVSMKARSGGSLEVGQDFLRLYKKVDGGPEVLIAGADGNQAVTTWLGNIATGSNLVLVIRARVSATAEYYYFDDLSVQPQGATTNYTLTTIATNGFITLNPPGGVYNAGTLVTMTAIASNGYAFTNWSGNLAGSTNPSTITMNGNKSVTANFAVSSGLTSLRVNCGGSSYDAGGGMLFETDGIYNIGGNTFSTGLPIAGTTNDPLYQTERWGNSFSYGIPVVNGNYEVTLMFAEINFNTAGSRVFNVAIEGTQVISNLDIWAMVGKDAAYNVTNIVTVSDGQLNIAFSSVVENPKISAIQVQRIIQDSYFQPPILQGGQLRLEWVGGGTLQTSTNVLGPWSDVSGASSPYLNPTTNSAQFFRVRK